MTCFGSNMPSSDVYSCLCFPADVTPMKSIDELLYQFIFRVDGHAHRRTFAKRRSLHLLVVIIVIR